MRRTIGITALLLTFAAGNVTGQAKTEAKQAGAPKAANAITWADLTGDWVGKSMRGNSDSVITEVTTTFGADKKVWVKFPNRDPLPARMVSMGGDSVVVEVGPYDSITRAGHKVTTRMTSHVRDHKMHGTFSARFDDGASLTGRSEASHKMK